MAESSITTWHRLEPGQGIVVDGEEMMLVLTTTGSGDGPFTSTVRPFTARERRAARWRGLFHRARRWTAHLQAPYVLWRDSRCDPAGDFESFCWHRAEAGGKCARHQD